MYLMRILVLCCLIGAKKGSREFKFGSSWLTGCDPVPLVLGLLSEVLLVVERYLDHPCFSSVHSEMHVWDSDCCRKDCGHCSVVYNLGNCMGFRMYVLR